MEAGQVKSNQTGRSPYRNYEDFPGLEILLTWRSWQGFGGMDSVSEKLRAVWVSVPRQSLGAYAGFAGCLAESRQHGPRKGAPRHYHIGLPWPKRGSQGIAGSFPQLSEWPSRKRPRGRRLGFDCKTQSMDSNFWLKPTSANAEAASGFAPTYWLSVRSTGATTSR